MKQDGCEVARAAVYPCAYSGTLLLLCVDLESMIVARRCHRG